MRIKNPQEQISDAVAIAGGNDTVVEALSSDDLEAKNEAAIMSCAKLLDAGVPLEEAAGFLGLVVFHDAEIGLCASPGVGFVSGTPKIASDCWAPLDVKELLAPSFGAFDADMVASCLRDEIFPSWSLLTLKISVITPAGEVHTLVGSC